MVRGAWCGIALLRHLDDIARLKEEVPSFRVLRVVARMHVQTRPLLPLLSLLPLLPLLRVAAGALLPAAPLLVPSSLAGHLVVPVRGPALRVHARAPFPALLRSEPEELALRPPTR